MPSYGGPAVRGIARAGLLSCLGSDRWKKGGIPARFGKAKQGPLPILQATPSTFSSPVADDQLGDSHPIDRASPALREGGDARTAWFDQVPDPGSAPMPKTVVPCSMPGCQVVAVSKVAAPWRHGPRAELRT